MFRRYVLPWLAWFFYRLWTWTWRIELVQSAEAKAALLQNPKLIFAHWHGSELCIVPLVTDFKIATMTSTSKDGQLIDFVIRRFGGATSRGSSTRGGVSALKGLIRLIGEGYRASMAVDGPKGPLHKVKPGVFELSRLAHAQIIPVGVACKPAITFEKSWNKAQLPKPFARVVVCFGKPWPIIDRERSTKDPKLSAALESQIASACQQATEHLR